MSTHDGCVISIWKFTILIVHACLGIRLEPVVSRSYHFPGRQHDAKSFGIFVKIQKQKLIWNNSLPLIYWWSSYFIKLITWLKWYACDDCLKYPFNNLWMKNNSKTNKMIIKHFNWEYFKSQMNQQFSETET